MSDKEILAWLNRNCKAHINWGGEFVLLAHIPGKPTAYTEFSGMSLEEAVRKATKAQGILHEKKKT